MAVILVQIRNFLQLLWNLVYGGFWGRWLQIWCQNCKIQEGKGI